MVPGPTLALVSSYGLPGLAFWKDGFNSEHFAWNNSLHVHAPVSAATQRIRGAVSPRSLAILSMVKDLVSEYNVVKRGIPVQPLRGLVEQ